MPENLGNLRTRVQARADAENDTNLGTTLLNGFINQSRKRLRRVLVSVFPEYFLKSKSFTLSGTSYTYDLNANVTDFWKVRLLEWVTGSQADQIVKIPRISFSERPSAAEMGYRIYAGTLEIRPASQAQHSYVLWYIAQPPTMADDTNDKLDLAEDMWDEFIVLEAAIKARKRQQKGAQDLVDELKELYVEIRASASDNDVGEPDHVIDVESTGYWRERLPAP